MRLPVYVGGGASTPGIFRFDVFICVLLKTEFVEVVLIVLVADLSLYFLADLEVSSVISLLLSWFSISLEGVGAFRLFWDFLMSLSSMRLLNSSTWGVGCGES